MKNKLLLGFAVFFLLLFTCNVYAQTVLESFAQDAMFIEGSPLISPDNQHIALQARDKANRYTNKAHLWIGSMTEGGFSKIYEEPVRNICWINNQEVAFLDSQASVYQFWLKDPAPPQILIKAIHINTKAVRELYQQKIKTIPGSGGQFETINLLAISNTGRYLLMNDKNGFYLRDIKEDRRLLLENFNYSFSGRSRFRFNNKDTQALSFDDKSRTYTLYTIDESGVLPVKQFTTAALGGNEPTGYFRFSDPGNRLIFASEKCSGNCYYDIYVLDISSGSMDKRCKVSGGKILSLDWSRDLEYIVYNDHHTRLVKQRCGTE
jgi:hypothetical protein